MTDSDPTIWQSFDTVPRDKTPFILGRWVGDSYPGDERNSWDPVAWVSEPQWIETIESWDADSRIRTDGTVFAYWRPYERVDPPVSPLPLAPQGIPFVDPRP